MDTQDNVTRLKSRVAQESKSALDQLVQQGAQRMLQSAIEAEVAAYIEAHESERDEDGLRLVVRNGHQPERQVQTGAGRLTVRKPRVHDRREGRKFTSKILPPYMRRSPSLDALIPALYLRGVSTGDFQEALEAILGKGAAGLSATNIVRLKESSTGEYKEWAGRDLTGKRYVYLWADGIYFNVRLTSARPCVLVIMGTTPEGKKELVGLLDGERESTLSWKELLLDLKRRGLKRRGLKEAPKLAVADGGLGFWPALEEVYPEARHQRCWVHKMANVLNKLAKSLQSGAKRKLREMQMAPTKREALGAFDDFMALYEDKYPKACRCLKKDKEVLFTFYDFPAAHWKHLRTTNPIESTFATVRHRTRQTKGCGSREATLSMVYKLGREAENERPRTRGREREAEKRWRRLDAYMLVIKVLQGTRYRDGEEQSPREQPLDKIAA